MVIVIAFALAAAMHRAAANTELVSVVVLTIGAVVTAAARARARCWAVAAPCQALFAASALLQRAAIAADIFFAASKAAGHVRTFGAIVIVALAAKGAFVVLAIWAESCGTAEARARGFAIVALAHGLIAGSA